MNYTEFIKKYNGKKIDYDGVYDCQCVDLIDRYIVDVLQLKIGFWGNAKTWWTNRFNSRWLADNFYFIIPKFNEHETQRGDIGIRCSGSNGHIFIIDSANSNGRFSYYDTNGYGNNEAVTLRSRPYNAKYITGILRPKNQTNINTTLYGNGRVIQACAVYSDSRLENAIGYLYVGDRVCKLGTGNGNIMLCYPVNNYYKVGFIKSENFILD